MFCFIKYINGWVICVVAEWRKPSGESRREAVRRKPSGGSRTGRLAPLRYKIRLLENESVSGVQHRP